jgi:hypothetical protein
MKKEIQLPDTIIKKLQTLPETGMGYQVVNFKLKNGKSLNNITVLNCSIAVTERGMDISQIVDVEVSKDRN